MNIKERKDYIEKYNNCTNYDLLKDAWEEVFSDTPLVLAPFSIGYMLTH